MTWVCMTFYAIHAWIIKNSLTLSEIPGVCRIIFFECPVKIPDPAAASRFALIWAPGFNGNIFKKQKAIEVQESTGRKIHTLPRFCNKVTVNS